MGDGSFPNKRPSVPPDEAPPQEASAGARVIDFPKEEMANANQGLTTPVPAGTWADEDADAESDVDRLLRPAGVGAWTGGGEVVAFPQQPGTHRRPTPRSEEPTEGEPDAEPPAAEPPEAQVLDDDLGEPQGVDDDDAATSELGVTGAGEAGVEAKIVELRQSTEVSGTQITQAATEPWEEAAERPKFLASELLARDWTPAAPLRRTLRWGAIVVGTLGVVGMLTLGALAPEALGLTVLFALCAATGVAPLSPAARGSALALVGAAGAVAVGYLGHVTAQPAGTPLLIGCITLTASGLFFRAAHNRSRLARVLVAVGLLATAGWLVLTGGIDAVVVQSLEWQAWIQPSSRVLLGLIAVLTMLTFLDPSSHGGAWVAGFSLLAWLAIDAAGGGLLAVFPVRSAALDLADAEWTVRAALPLFAAIAAGGLCQVWVMLSASTRRSKPAASQTQTQL